jgi:hypothetical protein
VGGAVEGQYSKDDALPFARITMLVFVKTKFIA